MSVSFKHVLSQGPVLRALGTAAMSTLRSRNGHRSHADASGAARAIPATPGPWNEQIVEPRSPELIRDYLRNIGADPSWYRGRLPAHLFPQWGFPFAARAIADLPYPLTKVLNAGCRIEVNEHLRDDEPFLVRARLESIDDDGRRALITTKIVTETVQKPEAIVSELRAYVPLKTAGVSPGTPKSRSTVPADARELAFLKINADAGLDFAKLTGDFNPIHWIPAAARAAAGIQWMGLKSPVSFAKSKPASALIFRNASSRASAGTVDLDLGVPGLTPAVFNGTYARSSLTIASGFCTVSVTILVVISARRPSSSIDSRRARTRNGSSSRRCSLTSMRHPALSTLVSGYGRSAIARAAKGKPHCGKRCAGSRPRYQLGSAPMLRR